MRALAKLTLIQIKLFLREPIALFFTLAYAPMMLVLFGSIYGNEPIATFGGRGTVDVSVPAYIGLIIISVGLMSVPIATSSSREAGVLRRFRVTPLPPALYLLSDVTVYFLMTLAGVILLVLVGRFGYNMRFDGNILSVLGGFSLGTLAILACGYLIAGLAPTARIAQTAGMVIAFPMMFLSGATIPTEFLPDTVRTVGKFLPVTHVVTLMQGLWKGDSWSAHGTEALVLAGILVAGVFLAAKTFRWE
ncbi:MAG: ABC transporter permease [Anaerolineales bacterium]|nr:ABC transporter permease [Anaerolineales bacterium]